MKYQDICSKREYEVNGEKKVKWLNCGTLKTTDTGKMFIELSMFPNTDFFVFDKKEKGETNQEIGF